MRETSVNVVLSMIGGITAFTPIVYIAVHPANAPFSIVLIDSPICIVRRLLQFSKAHSPIEVTLFPIVIDRICAVFVLIFDAIFRFFFSFPYPERYKGFEACVFPLSQNK